MSVGIYLYRSLDPKLTRVVLQPIWASSLLTSHISFHMVLDTASLYCMGQRKLLAIQLIAEAIHLLFLNHLTIT